MITVSPIEFIMFFAGMFGLLFLTLWFIKEYQPEVQIVITTRKKRQEFIDKMFSEFSKLDITKETKNGKKGSIDTKTSVRAKSDTVR